MNIEPLLTNWERLFIEWLELKMLAEWINDSPNKRTTWWCWDRWMRDTANEFYLLMLKYKSGLSFFNVGFGKENNQNGRLLRSLLWKTNASPVERNPEPVNLQGWEKVKWSRWLAKGRMVIEKWKVWQEVNSTIWIEKTSKLLSQENHIKFC